MGLIAAGQDPDFMALHTKPWWLVFWPVWVVAVLVIPSMVI